jgi:phosphoglycolate phosphatase-like HAD superfamily hydrolase
MRVILFDLDGTLVSTGGAGVRALDSAFLRHQGIRRAMEGVSPAGKTDPLIVVEVFEKKLGRRPAAGEMETLHDSYHEFLAEELARTEGYRVMDGVRAVLDALVGRDDLLLGLGTGNWERGARLKLERAGLNGYFSFGGFGSDAEDRPSVLRAGVRRAEAKLGRAVPPRDVLVIGDTILDVKAGKAIGAVTVAVACGHGREAELRASGPDAYLEDFTDTAAALAALQVP